MEDPDAKLGAGTRRHFGNRHGRSEEARAAVLEAADGLLAEVGFAALTIEGIAARAGVGKQTIYRWWTSKTDILMDAFVADLAEDLRQPDSGTLAGDLRTYLARLAFFFKSDSGDVFRALAGEAQHDQKLAERIRGEFLEPQRRANRLVFQRAIKRGELVEDTDVDFMIDQVIGPIYFRMLISREPITREFTDFLVGGIVSERDPESGESRARRPRGGSRRRDPS